MNSRCSSSSVEPLLYDGHCDKEAHSDPKPLVRVRARRTLLFLTSVSLVSLSLLAIFSVLRHGHPRLANVEELLDSPLGDIANTTLLTPPTPPAEAPQISLDLLGPLASLNGLPTSSLWDNLRNDTKYISSWISAGWTNDVMTYGNLIYLALITDRVPIIGQFTPSHIGAAPSIKFGEVFDVPRLRKSLGRPILEWHEVKDEFSQEYDEIGCWNVWQAVQYREKMPRKSSITDIVKLDISYTVVPESVKIYPHFEHDQHSTFWSLAMLAFPDTRNANLGTPTPSPNHGVSLPPNEHLVCYDYLYYVAAYKPYEYDSDYSPAWRYVARHMRWTQSLEELADKYVRATIGVEDDKPTPPYISIHIRHGDFADWCGGVPKEDCFASATVIDRRVQEVKDELLLRKGLLVEHVIMTSDERDPMWWYDNVEAQGWLQVDHSKTVEMHGKWYPVLIDAVIHSNGMGFVGTDRSTMSIIARRRVQDWHDGAVRMVKWGTPDADDH